MKDPASLVEDPSWGNSVFEKAHDFLGKWWHGESHVSKAPMTAPEKPPENSRKNRINITKTA